MNQGGLEDERSHRSRSASGSSAGIPSCSRSVTHHCVKLEVSALKLLGHRTRLLPFFFCNALETYQDSIEDEERETAETAAAVWMSFST